MKYAQPRTISDAFETRLLGRAVRNARRGVLQMAYGDSEKTLQARARLTGFLWADTEFDCSPAGRRIRVQP